MPSTPSFSCSSAPTVSPGPDDHVEDAGRQARVVEDLGEVDAGQRRVARRLVDHGVAGDQRAARRTARQRHREVERADHGPDAVRLEHGPGVDGCVAEVAHRPIEAVVLLHHVAAPADQVGRLLDVAERLEPVLADLDRHERRELHLALADEVGGPSQQRHALLPRPPAPCRERRCGPPRSPPGRPGGCPARTCRPASRRSASASRTCRRPSATRRRSGSGGSDRGAPGPSPARARTRACSSSLSLRSVA